MNLRPIALLVFIIILAYLLQLDFVISRIEPAKTLWNSSVEYVLHFKDKEPYVFMFIPLVIVYLLGKH